MNHRRSRNEIIAAAEDASQHLSGYDREFFRRVWATEMAVYTKRLRAIGLAGRGHVLDAGSGNGQWTYCLSQLNDHVTGIDVSALRLRVTGEILDSLGIENTTLDEQSIAQTNFDSETFDAIFCYSVLYFCDHKQVLNEFYRLLRRGGQLYISTNGLGWYIYNLVTPHNPSNDFDVRGMAIRAVDNSIKYYRGEWTPDGTQVIVPSELLCRDAMAAGFTEVTRGAEGTLTTGDATAGKSFYHASYHGHEGIYEILAQKP